MLVDCDLTPGNSGGPLFRFDKQGIARIFGIVHGGGCDRTKDRYDCTYFYTSEKIFNVIGPHFERKEMFSNLAKFKERNSILEFISDNQQPYFDLDF